MDKEYYYTKMDVHIKDITIMTENTGTVFIHGLMERYMTATGTMGSRMARPNLQLRKDS